MQIHFPEVIQIITTHPEVITYIGLYNYYVRRYRKLRCWNGLLFW